MPKIPATPARLRVAIREVLEMAPGYGQSDEILETNVRELLPVHSFTSTDLLEAAEWNYARGYIAAVDNDDTDEREWHITREGIAKQLVS